MNNGPTKKQKTNSGEPVATYGPTWMNVDEAVKLLTDLVANKRYDLFFDTIKPLSFREISAISVALYRKKNIQTLAMLRSDKGRLWSRFLSELHKMDPSIIVEAPAGHENDALWHFRSVMQASHAIYQRQNKEIAHLKRKHPNHKQWLVIDTQDISANEKQKRTAKNINGCPF